MPMHIGTSRNISAVLLSEWGADKFSMTFFAFPTLAAEKRAQQKVNESIVVKI
jgi:hypothetical protein